MKRWIGTAAAAAGILALAGCGGGDEKEGGLTAKDDAELNEAGGLLDTTPDNLVPVENGTLDNGDSGAMDAVDSGEAAVNAAGASNIQ